jgi:hypothetical protein
VAFAISRNEDDSAAAFSAGSSFVLERPLTFDSIRRTLQGAHGLILRERRRSFRCPIAIPVSSQQEGESPICGETVDIGEGGMALTYRPPLHQGPRGKYNSLCRTPNFQSGRRPRSAGTGSRARLAYLFFRSLPVILLTCKNGLLSDLSNWRYGRRAKARTN